MFIVRKKKRSRTEDKLHGLGVRKSRLRPKC